MSKFFNRIILLLMATILVVGYFTLFTVHQTKQGLVLQFGDPKRILTEPGLNFKIPFIQNVQFIDKRILDLDAPAEEVIAADQKRLVVDAYVRFKIVEPLEFYKSVGNENIARARLSTITNSSIRRVVGEHPLIKFLSVDRSLLMSDITSYVDKEARNLGIEIVDVRIKRADLPEANSQADFRRMQTEREREAKEFRAQGAEISKRIKSTADKEVTVLLAIAERDANILRGEGDGEANAIFAGAFSKDPEFFSFYRSMQAYIAGLGESDTTMILSPESEFFKFFQNLEGSSSQD